MIYTTSISNIRNLQKTKYSGVPIYTIVAVPLKSNTITNITELAPDGKLLHMLKKGLISEYEYELEYIKKLNNTPNIDKLIKKIDGSVLTCYCSLGVYCHRHTLANYIRDKYNIQSKEITEDKIKLNTIVIDNINKVDNNSVIFYLGKIDNKLNNKNNIYNIPIKLKDEKTDYDKKDINGIDNMLNKLEMVLRYGMMGKKLYILVNDKSKDLFINGTEGYCDFNAKLASAFIKQKFEIIR